MSTDIFDEFFKRSPECDPNSEKGKELLTEEPDNCDNASGDGGLCFFAGMIGYTDAGACIDNNKQKNLKKIEQIKMCQQGLTETFNTSTILQLQNSNNLLFASLQTQASIFDQRMEILEIELTKEIDVANLISSTNLIILIIILTYLLFSKFFR